MTRILLAVLILAQSAIGQIVLPQNQQWTGANAFGSGTPPGKSASGSSAFVIQDFESAGTPSGWTLFAGTVTFHNTSSPLEGTGDLDYQGGSAQAYVQYTAQTEVYIVFLFKAVTLPSANAQVFGFFDSGFVNNVCGINVTTAGAIRGTVKGTQYATFGANISAATLYYVKMHYKAGSGANSIASCEFSTTGTWTGSGTMFISTSSGAATTSTTDADWINDAGTSHFRCDHVRIYTTDPGSTFSGLP